jgi:hypothetical protein
MSLLLSLEIGDPLVKVKVDRRRGCFDFEEPDWCSTVGTAHYAETLRLAGTELYCKTIQSTIQEGVD